MQTSRNSQIPASPPLKPTTLLPIVRSDGPICAKPCEKWSNGKDSEQASAPATDTTESPPSAGGQSDLETVSERSLPTGLGASGIRKASTLTRGRAGHVVINDPRGTTRDAPTRCSVLGLFPWLHSGLRGRQLCPLTSHRRSEYDCATLVPDRRLRASVATRSRLDLPRFAPSSRTPTSQDQSFDLKLGATL